MGRWALLGLGLLAFLPAGCLTEQSPRKSRFVECYRRFNCGDADVVRLEVRLIERPVGDSYINRDIWKHVNPWVVETDREGSGFERKRLLEKNGLRVGQIVGALPARLHALLTSERSCANPVCLVRKTGKPTTVSIGPVVDHCRFHVRSGGEKEPVELHGAQWSFLITPNPTANNNIRLTFLPRAEYGDLQQKWRSVPRQSSWMMEFEKPRRDFPELSWEVTLEQNEFLVIGASYEDPDLLGFQAFVDRVSRPPVQRLLVLRISRSAPRVNDTDGAAAVPGDFGAKRKQPLPLASHAAGTGAFFGH